MKILITGGAGFIGSHLADRLIDEGNEVAIIDNLSTGRKENINSRATFYNVDICDTNIAAITKKENPDLIYHLAAQIDARKSVKDPLADARINIIGSLNIIESFLAANDYDPAKLASKKIVFFSTGGVMYGEANVIPTPETSPVQPMCPYGLNKLTVEKYLGYYHKAFGLPFVVLRLANVYGPRQNANGEAGVVAIFCGKMLAGEKPLINGDGEQTRDYLFVDDAVAAARLADKKGMAEIFNIGTGRETSVNLIFAKLKEACRSDLVPVYGPAKPGEHKRGCLDSSKAKKELGWQPKYDLSEGLVKTAQWFEEKSKKNDA